MKSLKALMLLTFITGYSIAAEAYVQINCNSPSRSDGKVAMVDGILRTKGQTSEGYDIVKGKLNILLRNSKTNVFNIKRVEVEGVDYDNGSLMLSAPGYPELTTIYLNKNLKDLSYVELNGNFYRSNCLEQEFLM
jgi:hypothetical protein